MPKGKTASCSEFQTSLIFPPINFQQNCPVGQGDGQEEGGGSGGGGGGGGGQEGERKTKGLCPFLPWLTSALCRKLLLATGSLDG